MKSFVVAGVPARQRGPHRLESLCHQRNFAEQDTTVMVRTAHPT